MANLLAHPLMLGFIFGTAAWAFPNTGRSPKVSPPLFVQKVETTWSSSGLTKTTPSFDVKAGDVLVAYAGQENGSYARVTVSGGSLSWTLQQEYTNGGAWADAAVWTAVVASDQTMTVNFDKGNVNNQYGGAVLTFRRTGGVGSSSKTSNSGAPSLSLTTTKANSAIVILSVDWNATNATHTWRTTAGSLTETTDVFLSSIYTANGGYHPNVGAAGAKTVGLSAPAGQKYSIVAVEIQGQ